MWKEEKGKRGQRNNCNERDTTGALFSHFPIRSQLAFERSDYLCVVRWTFQYGKVKEKVLAFRLIKLHLWKEIIYELCYLAEKFPRIQKAQLPFLGSYKRSDRINLNNVMLLSFLERIHDRVNGNLFKRTFLYSSHIDWHSIFRDWSMATEFEMLSKFFARRVSVASIKMELNQSFEAHGRNNSVKIKWESID